MTQLIVNFDITLCTKQSAIIFNNFVCSLKGVDSLIKTGFRSAVNYLFDITLMATHSADSHVCTIRLSFHTASIFFDSSSSPEINNSQFYSASFMYPAL